jgi:hypothetical protein
MQQAAKKRGECQRVDGVSGPNLEVGSQAEAKIKAVSYLRGRRTFEEAERCSPHHSWANILD